MFSKRDLVTLLSAFGVFVLICTGVVGAEETPEVVSIKHLVGYGESGRFCGWPANGGMWIWGNEIAVAYEMGWWKDTDEGHHRDEDKENEDVVIRSLDGGETWTMEKHPILGGCDVLEPPPGGIDFSNRDFAYKAQGGRFYFSYDRGKNWNGCYASPSLNCPHLSARTDYIVNGPSDCLFFSACDLDPDRAFCYQTTDGGSTFEFLGWMGPDDGTRSVCSSTVRCSETKLVSAMRRKYPGNWVDVFVSHNNGRNWQFLSKVANTDRGDNNGSPPALVRMNDGRLVCAYGYRDEPYGIRAKVSSDDGQTWSGEIHLRDDGLNWDLGYPRTVQRPDGKLVTCYYYCTAQRPQQFIGVTIWELEGTTMTSSGDFNQDGAVNFLDFSILVEKWLE